MSFTRIRPLEQLFVLFDLFCVLIMPYFCSVFWTLIIHLKFYNILIMCKLNSILVLAALAVFITSGCTGGAETVKTEKIIPVRTLIVSGLEAINEHNYVGTAEESFAISMSFSLMGTVEKVAVSEGQRVSKGQLLAALNSGTVQNTYDVSNSMLKQAQDAYDRLASLHKKGSVTDIQFVEVETGLQQAKSMEAIALKNLEDTKLYAPFTGIISKRSIEEGANVMPGVAAFKLVSIDEIDIKVPIPENEIGSISVGQSAIVTIPAMNNAEYTGRVDKKGVEANPISHTYDIRVRIKNPQLSLMPGMVGKVALQSETDSEQIIVPNRVVQITHDGKHFLWIADGSSAKRRFVTVGSLANGGVVIAEGLKIGDRVIVDGYSKVSEGMQISIIQ